MLVATGNFSPERGLPVKVCVDFNHFKSIIMSALLHSQTLKYSFLNLHRPYLLSSTKESKDNKEKIKLTINNTTNDGTINNNISNNNNDTTESIPNYGNVNNTNDNDYEPDNESFFINIDNILGDELNDNTSLYDTISINTENTTEIKDKNTICICFFNKTITVNVTNKTERSVINLSSHVLTKIRKVCS